MAKVDNFYALATLMCITMLNGCAIVPYEENYACEGTDDYGRCVSVQGAYEQAVTGELQGTKIIRDRDKDDTRIASDVSPDVKQIINVEESSNYVSYRESVYKKLKNMISEPTTPMVKQPEIIRTLVLNYQSEGEGTPLYMNRYVYFFGDKPKWVLGEYQQLRNELVMPVIEEQ